MNKEIRTEQTVGLSCVFRRPNHVRTVVVLTIEGLPITDSYDMGSLYKWHAPSRDEGGIFVGSLFNYLNT